MSSPYEQQIEDLLTEYRRQREEAVETRRRINETTATVTAPRQTVKITVGAQGEVTSIEFPTGAYRRMAPKELTEVLLSTIQQARSEAMESAAAIVNEKLPPGMKLADLLQGKADLSVILPDEPQKLDSISDFFDRSFGGGTRA